MSEAYESVLLEVSNLSIGNPFPDAPGNFGEFEVNDGSGPCRIDDAMTSFNGNLDTTFKAHHTIDKIIGIGYFSHSNYKILPRSNNDIIGHFTSIDNDINNIAENFKLYQNYPNPFNNNTVIKFDISNNSPTSLIIYDMVGKEINTLFSKTIQPGYYEVNWNGENYYGNISSTGIYFFQLRSGDKTQTKKMLFIK